MSELSDDCLPEIIEWAEHRKRRCDQDYPGVSDTYVKVLTLLKELQRRRALPAVGDVERVREATIEECAKIVDRWCLADSTATEEWFLYNLANKIRALSAAPSGDGREVFLTIIDERPCAAFTTWEGAQKHLNTLREEDAKAALGLWSVQLNPSGDGREGGAT